MTKAVTATKAKPKKRQPTKRQPTCQNPACKTRFRTTNPTAKYCGTPCREEVANTKKRVVRTGRATESHFFYHLAYEVERAGNLQVLGLRPTLESMTELHKVYRACQRYNRDGNRTPDSIKWEISHIFPVAGGDRTGLYTADNLVISSFRYNRSHGNNHFSGGASIARTQLQSRYKVEKGAPRSETVERIVKYLGDQLVCELVDAVKLKKSDRKKVIDDILLLLDPNLPEHIVHMENLKGMRLRALRDLRRFLNCELVTPSELAPSADEDHVLLCEWGRIAVAFRPDLLPSYQMLEQLREITRPTFKITFEDVERKVIWDALHGKTNLQAVAAIARRITDSLWSDPLRNQWLLALSPASPDERIPAYAPIVFNVNKPAPSSSLLAKPFADTLDDECHVDTSMCRVPAWEAQDSAPPF